MEPSASPDENEKGNGGAGERERRKPLPSRPNCIQSNVEVGTETLQLQVCISLPAIYRHEEGEMPSWCEELGT